MRHVPDPDVLEAQPVGHVVDKQKGISVPVVGRAKDNDDSITSLAYPTPKRRCKLTLLIEISPAQPCRISVNIGLANDRYIR